MSPLKWTGLFISAITANYLINLFLQDNPRYGDETALLNAGLLLAIICVGFVLALGGVYTKTPAHQGMALSALTALIGTLISAGNALDIVNIEQLFSRYDLALHGLGGFSAALVAQALWRTETKISLVAVAIAASFAVGVLWEIAEALLVAYGQDGATRAVLSDLAADVCGGAIAGFLGLRWQIQKT